MGPQAAAQEQADPNAPAILTAPSGSGDEPAQPRRIEVLQVGDQRFGAIEFGSWLLQRGGRTAAPRYAEHLAFLQEAARLGLEFDEEQATQLLDEELRQRLKGAFEGDRNAWLTELAQAGRSELGFRTQRLEEIQFDQVRNAVVLEKRTIDEDRIRQEWNRVYGPEGRSMRVLGIRRSIRASSNEDRRTREEVRAEAEAQAELARAELASVAIKLANGSSFGALVRAMSDDEESAQAGGLVAERWNGQGWPPSATEQLMALEPGGVTEPIRGAGGVWVLYLESATVFSFESVRGELLTRIENRPPSVEDHNTVTPLVLAAANIELLPALGNPDFTTPQGRVAPVMQVGGSPVSLVRFESWLRRNLGEIYAPEFALEQIVEATAKEAGVDTTAEEVARRAIEQRELELELGFKGSKVNWLEELESLNLSEDLWTQEAQRRARIQVLSELLVRKENPITEADVRTLWLTRYGAEGRQIDVRLIRRRVSVDPPGEGENDRAFEKRRLKAVLDTVAELEELVERVDEGEDFGALARRYSDHASSVTNGVPSGDFSVLGAHPEFNGPILEASLGQVVGPLVEKNDVFLFEIIGSHLVPFDSVRDRLLEELRSQRVPALLAAGWRSKQLTELGFKPLDGMFR